jgi:uncharacterized SAM-binding protein YcdF (DUF218 family)
VGLVLLLIVSVVLMLAALVVRVVLFARRLDPTPRGEVIVVLGAKLFSDGRLSPAFEGRIERAVELFKAKAAPLILFSGGGQPSEARAAVAYAKSLGVDETACLLEEQSTNTLENARYSAQLLAARGVRRVVLVSDGFHLFRAVRCFRLYGIESVPAASRRVLTAKTLIVATAKEAIAYLRIPPRAR